MRKFLIGVAAAVLAAVTVAKADDLEPPGGRVILEVSGSISTTNAPGKARFDLAMLDAMPQQQIVASTPWLEGETVFDGVPLRLVLERVGISKDATTLSAIALNDYKVEIPVSDAFEQGVIIASRLNGETMSIRDKGPLWVIYPISDNPDINNQATYSKMIWQLNRLIVE